MSYTFWWFAQREVGPFKKKEREGILTFFSLINKKGAVHRYIFLNIPPINYF